MESYKGINYQFRPDSYWVDKGIRQSILRDVKGTQRRRIIDKALRSPRFVVQPRLPLTIGFIWKE